jgi:hypothetical protein
MGMTSSDGSAAERPREEASPIVEELVADFDHHSAAFTVGPLCRRGALPSSPRK